MKIFETDPFDIYSEDAEKLSIFFSRRYYDIGILTCKSSIRKNPEIKMVLDEHEHEIKDFLSSEIQFKSHIIFSILCKLRTIGITWPWVNEMLLTEKSTFIKKLLSMFKEDEQYLLNQILYNARKAKLNWPELNVIQKKHKC